MYIMKISKDKQLLDVMHFEKFENAVAAIADTSIFDDLPNEVVDSLDEFGVPKITHHSYNNETQTADDFEFKYQCGICVYVGQILTKEEERRKGEIPKS